MKMPELSFALARELCTPVELRLLAAARKQTLAAATPAQLRKQIDLARRQRDKWTDQQQAQKRKRQADLSARGVDAAKRSRQKSELFAAALARFEARLAAVGEAPGAGKPAAKAPTKQQRNVGHRQTRATVKATLRDKKVTLRTASRAKAAKGR